MEGESQISCGNWMPQKLTIAYQCTHVGRYGKQCSSMGNTMLTDVWFLAIKYQADYGVSSLGWSVGLEYKLKVSKTCCIMLMMLFCASFSPTLMLHKPYNHFIPASQAEFLLLLDSIGVPHEDAKQQHGIVLEIIGFEVDLAAMTI
jgi:hypothetical protein